MKKGFIVNNAIRKLRSFLFPTLREKELVKWRADDGESLRYNYDLNSDSLVLDVGGYKGQWASDIYSMYNCNIIIIEPVKSFANKIEKRFIYNNNVEVFSIALGQNRRSETISMSNDGTSIFKESRKKESIQYEDIVHFFSTKKIVSIDLMKINIEGGEYELLERMIIGNLIANVKYIQIQFHDFVPGAAQRMEKIQKQLSITHTPSFQYKYVWENWVRIDE